MDFSEAETAALSSSYSWFFSAAAETAALAA